MKTKIFLGNSNIRFPLLKAVLHLPVISMEDFSVAGEYALYPGEAWSDSKGSSAAQGALRLCQRAPPKIIGSHVWLTVAHF